MCVGTSLQSVHSSDAASTVVESVMLLAPKAKRGRPTACFFLFNRLFVLLFFSLFLIRLSLVPFLRTVCSLFYRCVHVFVVSTLCLFLFTVFSHLFLQVSAIVIVVCSFSFILKFFFCVFCFFFLFFFFLIFSCFSVAMCFPLCVLSISFFHLCSWFFSLCVQHVFTNIFVID